MDTHSRPNHRRTRLSLLAASIVLLVAAAGCGGVEDAAGNPLDGSMWELISLRSDADLVAAHPTTIATAVFSDGQVYGSTGCNLYQAPYSVSSDAITLGDLAASGSACDPDYVEQGDAFLRAMRRTTRFVLTTESLELRDASGATQVVFRPAAELPLTWVDWRLVWYGDGKAPLDGTQINLVFRGDATLTGTAGCNSYSADYGIDRDRLEIGAITRTAMRCVEPDGVMTQEVDYLDILERAARFATTLTGLELLDSDGHPVAEYRFGGRIRDDVSGAPDIDQDPAKAAVVGLNGDAHI